MIVVGGIADGIGLAKTSEMFSPQTRSWHQLANTNKEHLSPSMAFFQGHAIVAGSYTNTVEMLTLDKEDPKGPGQWTLIRSLCPTPPHTVLVPRLMGLMAIRTRLGSTPPMPFLSTFRVT